MRLSLWCAPLAIVGTALLVACERPRPTEAHAGPPPAAAGSVQETLEKPLPVAAIGYDFQWRQRVTAKWRGGQRTFEAVLSRNGELLQLLGLGPMGRVGFVISVRDGQPMKVEHHPSLTFAFDPRYVLLDVQRAFYPWLEGTAPINGRRSAKVQGETIVEEWKNGALELREFRRPSDPQSRTIRIRYSQSTPSVDVAELTVLENGRLGYTLEIQTLSQTRLSP
jgi:hypothetical protein